MDTRVRTGTLNLRSAPSLSAPILAVLAAGQELVVAGSVLANGFVAVRLERSGAPLEGYVWSAFLEELPPAPTTGPAAVHLKPPIPIRRRDDTGHAYPLLEPDLPAARSDAIDAAALIALMRWLGVEKGEHRRYRPKAGTTYCNVYAYDYCYLAGVYLPRVWWRKSSLDAQSRGERVHAEWNDTVDELSANALYRWLEAWSGQFGWLRVDSLDDLQAAANRGEVAVISARRHKEADPGHISIVAPESDGVRAQRQGDSVTLPVQSQAGATLLEYGHTNSAWWTGSQFAQVGFWRHI